MDRLPRHFRRSPSEWNDIGNFINTRARNNSRGHFKSFQNYLKLIANASDATEDQKAAAVDLMETITLPEFQVQLRLAEQRAKASADDHSKTIVRENSFTCARTLIIHAESEIVKSITGQPSNRQVGGQSSQTSNQQPQASTEQGKQHRKRSRSDELEISSFFSEPWGSLIKILHDRLRCGVSNTSIPPGVDLSVPSKALYTFIRAHLQDDKDLTEHEQDLLVALSGVINLRVPNAREIYGVRLINNIEALAPAAQPDTSISPTLKSLKDILDKNGLRYLRDEISLLDTERILKVRRGEHVEPSLKVVLDVVRFLADKIVAGTLGASEYSIVSTWQGVLDLISEGVLKLEPGELTSDATEEIRVLQELEFNGTSKGVCGRKMDLHLHFDKFELNNSEFKAAGTDVEVNRRQSSKNIRINKAMMVYLRRHAKFEFQGDYLVYLDVTGYTGALVYLHPFEDIHVSGLLSKVPVKLPYNERSFKLFLDGPSMGWLFTYVRHLSTLQTKFEDKMIQTKDESFMRQERTTPH